MNVDNVESAIKTILDKITPDSLAHEAMQLSQAALNLSHVPKVLWSDTSGNQR